MISYGYFPKMYETFFFLKTKHDNILAQRQFINLITASVFHIGYVAEWSKALVPDPMRSSLEDVGSNPTMAKYIFIFFYSLVSCVRI